MSSVLDDFQVPVLDHGFVRLDACMADDLSVVNAARVSFAVRKEEMGKGDEGLIGYLMKHKHGTPFEHNAFRFHIKCPIFVAREWMRHRIGSFNEWSGRYSQLEAEAYVPEPEQVRTQVGKPGHYHYEALEADLADQVRDELYEAYETAFTMYALMLGQGVAKEVARLVLPVGTFTQFYWTVNARSLMNFLSLRLSEEAQWEIRQYAEGVRVMFMNQMPVTHDAWLNNGMVAP